MVRDIAGPKAATQLKPGCTLCRVTQQPPHPTLTRPAKASIIEAEGLVCPEFLNSITIIFIRVAFLPTNDSIELVRRKR